MKPIFYTVTILPILAGFSRFFLFFGLSKVGKGFAVELKIYLTFKNTVFASLNSWQGFCGGVF